MASIIDVLKERGYIEQMTHEEEIKELLDKEKISFYIGFDPTADSLHVGHFVAVMLMAHMQRAGHRPIALVGGGTGMVGDPTDKSDMRRVMTTEEIDHNCECFKKQLARFIDFEDGKALMVNNADWLRSLNYMEFIRDYGVHFSVNRMLTADTYRKRFERGLSFFELNYMVLQSYDFLELNRRYDCKMQLGGNDQWSNIIGGIELIRRVDNKQAYGLTVKLLTTSQGVKMGKSMGGAVWLDPEKTSPYDFYQYWRNVGDNDVRNCLCLVTFLPMDQINALCAAGGSEINHAKEVLAYEVTKIVHGEAEAMKAQAAAKALFAGGGDAENIPVFEVAASELGAGMSLTDIMTAAGLTKSRSEGRRLIQQGGVSMNKEKVADAEIIISADDFKEGEILIQKGKKVFKRVKLV